MDWVYYLLQVIKMDWVYYLLQVIKMNWVYYLFYLQLGIVHVTFVSILLKRFLPKYDGEIEEFHNNALATVTILGGIFFVLAIAAKIIEVTE